jgi:hypothetical protein
MICRDLNETKLVKIGDAEFTVGVISRRLWRNLSIKLGKVSGIIEKFKGKKMEDISLDKEFQEVSGEIQDSYFELVRLGLKNHSNLKTGDGKEIPFVKDAKGFASEATVELYDFNGILIDLGLEVLSFNQVAETERKN